MIQELQIIHRLKPHSFLDARESEAVVWETCLRSLAFAPHAPHADDEIFRGSDAYRFLLEVVCGLHSPIVGETEVFGQFKTFAQKWLQVEPQRAALVQRVLNDAKAIRSQYLRHLGTQSYGSWVRKNLHSKRVHIVGAGALVKEILPYLQKQNRDIVLHVRNPESVDIVHSGPIHRLDEQRFDHGALLVAAPLAAEEISAWLGAVIPEQVIDLRDNSARDQIRTLAKVHTLDSVFAEIKKNRHKLLPRLEKIRQEIVERCENVERRPVLRPQGWDDLCA